MMMLRAEHVESVISAGRDCDQNIYIPVCST